MLLFKDDLRNDFRLSERSAKVVRYWGSLQESYGHESGVAKECDAYLKLTAERVMFRVKVLGLPEPASFLTDRELLDVSFIDSRTPKLSELLDKQVRVAMAYVPLTPVGNVGNPVLARLYCAKGLQDRYFPSPMLQDNLLPEMGAYSWFLSGLPDENINRAIDGCSWLLAAELLMRLMVRWNAVTVRNLATRFIVTGAVSSDAVIRRVDLGRKLDLAIRPGLKNLKWLIPNENQSEVEDKMIKMDCPRTVEEAEKCIRTMQDAGTGILFEAVARGIKDHSSVPNKARIADQLKQYADVTQVVSGGENSLQKFRSMSVDYMEAHRKDDDFLRAQDRMYDLERLMSYYGCIPQMFFMLAKLGQQKMVEMLSCRLDINATDVNGGTALDFAIENSEFAAERVLRTCGAKRRGCYELHSKNVMDAIECMTIGRTDIANPVLKEALEYGTKDDSVENKGVDPNEVFNSFTEEVRGKFRKAYGADEDFAGLRWTPEMENYDEYAYRFKLETTTLLVEALLSGDKEIVEECIHRGLRKGSIIRNRYAEKKCMTFLNGRTEFQDDSPVKDLTFNDASESTVEDFIKDLRCWHEELISIRCRGLIDDILKSFK